MTEDITLQNISLEAVNEDGFVNIEDVQKVIGTYESFTDGSPQIFSECNYNIDDIVSVEQDGMFEDEYVYDVEVDGTHTFFANDILLHNSIYVEFGRLVRQFHIPKERQTQFVVDLWDYSLGPYMKKKYDT